MHLLKKILKRLPIIKIVKIKPEDLLIIDLCNNVTTQYFYHFVNVIYKIKETWKKNIVFY